MIHTELKAEHYFLSTQESDINHFVARYFVLGKRVFEVNKLQALE